MQNILPSATVEAWLRNSSEHFRKNRWCHWKDLLAVQFLTASFKSQLYAGEVVNNTFTNFAQSRKTSFFFSVKCNVSAVLVFALWRKQECGNTTWKAWNASEA